MNWLQWHLEGNVLAIMLAVPIAVAIVSMAIFGIPFRDGHPNSFGPDWECSMHEWGDPICIRKVKP